MDLAERNVEKIYPLSPIQEGVLYHVLEASKPGVYMVQFACRYRSPIDVERLRTAWQDTVAANPALRTLIIWRGRERPLQVVRKQVELPWLYDDWRDLSPAEQEERWRAEVERDRAAGFALDQAPLARIRLVRMADDEHAILFSFHHVVIDGWSMHLLLAEVDARYRGEHPEPAPVDYQQYLRWLDQRDAEAADYYWRDLLAGFDEPLEPFFLTDVLPGASTGHARVTAKVDAGRLSVFARAERVTLNTLVVAAWSRVLAAASGCIDVVFGTTISGRPADLTGIDRTVGLFINTVPMRVSASGTAPVGEWLRGIQNRQTRSRRHEHCPLARIGRSSELPRGAPLFETIVVFENMPTARATGPLAPFDVEHVDYSNYPLALLAVPGAALELLIIYDPARISETSAARLLDATVNALDSLPSASTVADVSIMPPDGQVPAQPAARDADGHGSVPVHLAFAAAAARAPEAPALVDPQSRVSYGELADRVSRLSANLRERGVGPGAVVPLCFDRSVEAVVAVMAVLSAGAAYVPLDTLQPRERIASLLDDLADAGRLQVPLLLTTSDGLADFEHIGVEVLAVDRLDLSGVSPLPPVPVEPGQLAYVIYTSGTTGRAKGVMVSHGNLASSTAARPEYYGTPPTRFLLLSSFATDSAAAGLFWTMTSGCTLFLPRLRAEQDMASLLDWISVEKITHTLCVPSLYRLILEEASPAALRTLETVIVAAEASGQALVWLHCSRLPESRLINEYGPTEATVWATAGRLDTIAPGDPVTIGTPVGGCSVSVRSVDGGLLPDGWPGEIYIGGPGVALGYLGLPEETARRFVRDPACPDQRLYRTGDLARRLPGGELEWLGRIDNQVKVRGYRVEPEEIEAVLAAHPAVREVAVVAPADPPMPAELAAALAQRPDAEEVLGRLEARSLERERARP